MLPIIWTILDRAGPGPSGLRRSWCSLEGALGMLTLNLFYSWKNRLREASSFHSPHSQGVVEPGLDV